MVTAFCCDGAKMGVMLEKLKSVEVSMETAYTAAASVKKEVESKAIWTGKSQKTMEAFLDLLTQYHKDFIKGEKAPVEKGIQCLEDLQSHLENFYEGWEEYEKLGEII